MRILVKRTRLVLGDRVLGPGETAEVDEATGARLLASGEYEIAPAPAAAPAKGKGG